MATVATSAVRSLEAALGAAMAGDVRTDAYSRHLYATDASMYAIEPIAVAFPRDADDVVAATEVARAHDVPVLPRGAGTSHCGQAVGEAVVLDCSRFMHAITELDPEARRAAVEPGVVQDDLNRAAAVHGLMFGADTSTSNRATLGGMIGNNSCGSRSARLGMTIDHVRSVDVVLADGARARLEPVSRDEAARRARSPGSVGRLHREIPALLERHRKAIDRDLPPYWRRSGGYRLERVLDGDTVDLGALLCGSEGTLATVVSADVALVPAPRGSVAVVGHFRSVEDAVAATPAALEAGADTAEMVDRFILDLARQSPEHRHLTAILEGEPEALLVCEFHGDSHAEAAGRREGLLHRWTQQDSPYAVLDVIDPARRKALGQLRKAGLGLLMAAGAPGERSLAFVEDAAVGPEHLPEFTRRFAAVLQREGLRAGFYGHASVGCLHVRPFMDLRQPDAVRRLRTVAEEVQELVAEYGGMNSSEHGDGLVRSEFNRRIFGDELYGAMQAVKRTFDPEGLMNPGKVVDAPPLTEHLREPALPPAAPLPTRYDFGDQGFREAANRCMRIGACRKGPGAGGVMCPSYMATRDEQHSTRGRANALVKALSEPDPRAALGHERLHEILDLCLGCKACVTECPMSIDMAAMKSEVLAQRHALHGPPLRARVLGRARALNRWGSATAPLSNVALRMPGARALLQRLAGVDARRPLPRFSRHNLAHWASAHRASPGTRGEVVVLADSFTSYTEPSIGRAAVTLLEQAGHTVTVATDVCCGRAQISQGLLEEGRAQARALVGALAAPARRGVPILGCEPSCVAALRDEHPALLGRDDPEVRAVAGAAQLVEDALAAAVRDGALPLRPSAATRRTFLLHGHCHQKASLGTSASRSLLELLPGAQVQELDAGCCGMAGSFGYEHYDLSMQIGEMRLFPAVRQAPPVATVVATGTSCRQQIHHGTGRQALHPAEVLQRAVHDGR